VEQGNALGQYYLGAMFRDGTGVKQDKEEAAKWFKMATDNLYN
jgi:TPR repeat protein